MKFRVIILVLVFGAGELFSQEQNSSSLSRLRILPGMLTTGAIRNDGLFFIDFNFYVSGFSREDTSEYIGLSINPGLQFFAGDDDIFFSPYIKAGPEFRLSENFFINAGGGLQFFLHSRTIMYPFLSIAGLLTADLNDDLSIEFEGGMTSYLSQLSPGPLPYLKIGFALR